jgi:hypothetical protein
MDGMSKSRARENFPFSVYLQLRTECTIAVEKSDRNENGAIERVGAGVNSLKHVENNDTKLGPAFAADVKPV